MKSTIWKLIIWNFRLTPSIFKIIVGEGDDAQEFQIHEAVLTARSKFFKAAIGRKWKESEEKTVKLPEDDPEAFALYSQLVYTGQIPGMSDNIPQSRDVADARKRDVAINGKIAKKSISRFAACIFWLKR